MIEKIDNEQVRRLMETAGQQKPAAGKARVNNEPDATLQADFTAMIEQAKVEPDGSAAVEKARQLLKTGQLETKENIRQAAENILKFGI
jgi:predicted Zn-dependent peptidase